MFMAKVWIVNLITGVICMGIVSGCAVKNVKIENQCMIEKFIAHFLKKKYLSQIFILIFKIENLKVDDFANLSKIKFTFLVMS